MLGSSPGFELELTCNFRREITETWSLKCCLFLLGPVQSKKWQPHSASHGRKQISATLVSHLLLQTDHTAMPIDSCSDSPVLNDEALPQAELAEDVHYDFHGRVHSDRKGAEVQDAAQFDCRRSTGWHGWITFSEQDGRHADHSLLMPTCIF